MLITKHTHKYRLTQLIILMLPLKLQSLGLAPVVAPSLVLLLIAAETRPELDINARWCREPKALCHLDEIELVHVEDRAQGVRRIRLDVRAVAFFRGLHMWLTSHPCCRNGGLTLLR